MMPLLASDIVPLPTYSRTLQRIASALKATKCILITSNPPSYLRLDLVYAGYEKPVKGMCEQIT